MRSLARPSFFRMFDLLVAQGNPGLKRSKWTHAGAEFERERHSFTSSRHGIVIDIVTITRSGRQGWSLMVTKEYWWGPDDKPFKNVRWARPLSGQRSDLFAWLRTQEAALDEALAQELGRAGPSSPAESSESSTARQGGASNDWTIDEGVDE